MKGAKLVSLRTQNTDPLRRRTWVKIYYDFETKEVGTRKTNENYFVAEIIYPSTEYEVEDLVERWIEIIWTN